MRRDAYGLGVALALMLAAPAFAQGFAPFYLSDTGDTCYSWEGGSRSAGSFSKCQPAIIIAQAPPVIVQTPVAPVAAPMQSCPPQIIMEPEPRKRVVPRKPRPKMVCKPA